eukprot:16341-Heterococcus_DN1.PRE.2
MNAITTEFTALDYLSSSTFRPNCSQAPVALTAFSSSSPLAGSLVQRCCQSAQSACITSAALHQMQL